MEVINRIGKALEELYPSYDISIDDIVQHGEEKGFILQFVSKRDIKVAGIRCNKAYTVDIVYYDSKEERVFEVIDALEKNLQSKISYMDYSIEILEKEGHFTIEVMDENPKTKEPYLAKGLYKVLREKIEFFSGKEVFFTTVDLKEANLEKGFYVLSPVSLESSTISLNHKKEYEEEIELLYLDNSSRSAMHVWDEHEEFMRLVCEDMELRKQYINLDYEMALEEEEEEFSLLGVVVIRTTITIKRRG